MDVYWRSGFENHIGSVFLTGLEELFSNLQPALYRIFYKNLWKIQINQIVNEGYNW